MALGDPNTCPEEETVFVPNSFDLERDAQDWENCALVPWAMHLPRGVGAKDIEELLLHELHLRRGDVTVTINQPEPYLIRFDDSAHCAEARRRGRFKGNGIEICLRRWHSLTNALGMCIFFRVRLYLDGIPDHAWTLDIVERVIGSKCALQCINTDLIEPTDTRHIDLWAWTANPSEIPKRVWLVFTHRPTDKSSVNPSVVVVTRECDLPDRWQQGIRYEVFLHIGVVEDYSAASLDLQGAVANLAAFTSVRRPYVWRYGVMDGAPEGTRARFPVRLPRPPREPEDGGRDGRDKWGQAQDKGGRQASRHNAGGRRGDGRSCKEGGFSWPPRRDDDDDASGDDGDYAHPGHGGRARHEARRGADSMRRERTRSPRRRDAEFRGGGGKRRSGEPTPTLAPQNTTTLFPVAMPNAMVLKTMAPAALQAFFTAKATELKLGLQAGLGDIGPTLVREANDYIDKALRLADRLGIDDAPRPSPTRLATGNGAWFELGESLVPAVRVFDRIKSATAPTVEEVGRALHHLVIASAAVAATEDFTTTPAGWVTPEPSSRSGQTDKGQTCVELGHLGLFAPHANVVSQTGHECTGNGASSGELGHVVHAAATAQLGH
ncbi:unnamed protein product [Urochloa humidicola]